MAKSRNLPGVTKSLMWVRLGGVEGSQENCIELLDSPGIIPARQLDQEGNETPAIQLLIYFLQLLLYFLSILIPRLLQYT